MQITLECGHVTDWYETELCPGIGGVAWCPKCEDDQIIVAVDDGLDHDVYLFLNETAHGRRFWRVAHEADSEKMTLPDRTIRVLGPAIVGPNGYENAEEAAYALADFAGIDLDEPETWD